MLVLLVLLVLLPGRKRAPTYPSGVKALMVSWSAGDIGHACVCAPLKAALLWEPVVQPPLAITQPLSSKPHAMPSKRGARNLVGRHAIPFQLPSSHGGMYKFKPGGRPVAIFFFPAAGTVGCILQTCSIRDASNSKEIWSRASCDVIGISGNTVEENRRFVDDYRLPFTVLSDVDGAVRNMYRTGKGMLGYDARVTFFIDSQGIIREMYDSFVNAIAHRKFIEAWLEKVEIERQPWSKFLDYETILTEYDPGTIGGGNSSALAARFSQVFADSDGTASDDDDASLTSAMQICLEDSD